MYFGLTDNKCRESLYKWWVKIEGLSYTEMRHLTERIGEQAERHSERDMVAEFSIPTWALLNGLESLGYKVNIKDLYFELKLR